MSAGVQDKPPQNMLLWYIGYVELKTLEKQQMLGEAFSELTLFIWTDPPKGTQHISLFLWVFINQR